MNHRFLKQAALGQHHNAKVEETEDVNYSTLQSHKLSMTTPRGRILKKHDTIKVKFDNISKMEAIYETSEQKAPLTLPSQKNHAQLKVAKQAEIDDIIKTVREKTAAQQ